MNTVRRVAAALGLGLALCAGVAAAKSPPDRLTITGGPGGAAPAELTGPASLASFNPWSREFIAWDRGLVARPPALDGAYTVTLYLTEHGSSSPIYVFHYVPSASGEAGLIYIPGPGEAFYRVNIGTIMTGSSDRWDPNGKWQYAADASDAILRRALASRTGALPVTSSDAAMPPVGGGVVDRAVLFAAGFSAVLTLAVLASRRRFPG